ncbi:MAG: cupin-like domain-containing protein [Sphingobium sp.]|nr:cupin-like domain-containing protein [Sphingobium sp.]
MRGTPEEIEGLTPDRFVAEIQPAYRPVILRGLAKDWPAVRAARESNEAVARYVSGFDQGRTTEAFLGTAEMAGRFFYGSDIAAFNFRREAARISEVLGFLVSDGVRADAPSVYIGATAVPDYLPGFERSNPMSLLAGKPAVPRIWIGNRSTIAAHFDISDNIACVVAGRRRFTLFPPEQVANLYVGPLDHTMAGQPASMVDLANPDFERFPRFREALGAALVAELEPGDAIYIPPLWWHHVQTLAPFNILLNYWWEEQSADAGSPFEAMVHAILSVSRLPGPQRQAWSRMFDHYVFRPTGEDPAAHLPESGRGILAEPTPQLRIRIRQFLMRVLGAR